MKVVLINQSTGYLMVDIANAYSEKYEEVILFAGNIVKYERPLSSKIKIEKLVRYNKSSIFKRIYTWLYSFVQITWKLKTRYKDAYVIYVTNPPLSYWAALFTKNAFSIIEYDIYPEALKNIGIKETHFIYKIWGTVNRKIFKRADCIFTLSDGMKFLLSKYTDVAKIKIIYNWSSNSNLSPLNKNLNPFIEEHNLQNKFVIMYSGNIGYTHNVELLLDLAIKFKQDSSIHFMVIGDGGKKKDLMNTAFRNDLTNCTFLDWQPAEKIQYSLAAADLSVVTLTEETAFVSVPSKTYNLLAVGSPLLCIAPKKSELAKLVNEEMCGAVYEKTEFNAMCDFVEKIKGNIVMHQMMKMNALKASEKYTYTNAKKYVI